MIRILVALLALQSLGFADEPDNQREYSRLRVGFFKIVDADSSRWGGPYLGAAEKPLDLAAFYRAVGHPEHARFYTERSTKKLRIVLPSLFSLLAGTALTVAGGVIGVAHPFCRAQDHYGACIDADTTPNAPMLGVGITLFAGGIVGLGFGGSVHRFPTSPAENIRLAREHNRALRQRLQLPDGDDPNVPTEDSPSPISRPKPKREVPSDTQPLRLGPQTL